MVRCTKYLEIMVDENILENVRVRHDQVIEGLTALAAAHPGRIKGIRGRGLMIAFDLETQQARNALVSKIFDNGAIILPCGHRTIRFRPPLNITAPEVDKAMKIIGKSMDEVF
jgi:L-lysine 6-transaminase